MNDDWQRHLPPEAQAEMIAELAETPARHLDAVTAAWRSTAEVYANPELHAALTRDNHEDGGRVTLPDAGGRTIAVYIPSDVPDEIADWLETTIADTVHDLDDGKPWDIHVVGQAGDPLHIWTEPAPTRDWNDVPPALQQRILAAVEQARRGETVDLGDFSQYLDTPEA